MTTVLESGGPRGGLTFVDAIASWIDPVRRRRAARADLPRRRDRRGGRRSARRMLFSTSESNAVAAAMNYLDRPLITQIVVTAVFGDTPADGVLLPKDEILSIDGIKVTESPTRWPRRCARAPIGTTFEIGVRRDGVEVDGADEGRRRADRERHVGGQPRRSGRAVHRHRRGEVLLGGVPDRLHARATSAGRVPGSCSRPASSTSSRPDDLTAGKHIAGTGTIEPDGTVGPIGGIRQKLAGARDGRRDPVPDADGRTAPRRRVTSPTASRSSRSRRSRTRIDAIQAYTAGKPVAILPGDGVVG